MEDANPQFRVLRDLTDVRNCVRLNLLTPASTAGPPSEVRPRSPTVAALSTYGCSLAHLRLQP